MITHDQLVEARTALLERIVAWFAAQPDVIGIVLTGSIPAGTADHYSDIDLRVVATAEGQARLLAGRLHWPAQWGDLLFNEWMDGTRHCVSHFAPFLKVDVFYSSPETFIPSPWLKLPVQVFLDRTGLVQEVLDGSTALAFPSPDPAEVSRIVSKALASAHETVRRSRRGELFFAQTLLEEFRSHLMQLDAWLRVFAPTTAPNLRMERRLSPAVRTAVGRSYVELDADAIEDAAVDLTGVLAEAIVPALHRAFSLDRALATDLRAADVVKTKQVERSPDGPSTS